MTISELIQGRAGQGDNAFEYAADLSGLRMATFTPGRTHRLALTIKSKPACTKMLHFCMLNPSTADELDNDPTVERCLRRALKMGMDGVIITNAYGWRDTHPNKLYAELRKGTDIVGPHNDRMIVSMACFAQMTILGWGKHCEKLVQGRGATIVEKLLRAGVTPMCLGRNDDGSPKHPLYIGYDVTPVPFAQ